jgi:hypothetical protein
MDSTMFISDASTRPRRLQAAQAAGSRPWFKRPINLLLVLAIGVALQMTGAVLDALVH